MSITLQQAQSLMNEQPFNRLIGGRLTALGDGVAVIEIEIRPDLLQQNGYVHGGVLGYAADMALTCAAADALGASVLTANWRIDFLQPAIGDLLRATGTVVHASHRQALSRAELVAVATDGTQTLVCAAQGTAVAVHPRPRPFSTRDADEPDQGGIS